MNDFQIPIGDWISLMVDWLLDNAEIFFDIISFAIGWMTGLLDSGLSALPLWILALILVLLGWWRVSWRMGLFILAAMAVIVGMDLWTDMVSTLALVLSATLFSLVIGIPLGIAMAKSDMVERLVRPVLDFMQTMPAFVYLIPAVMFFGLGQVPGTIATIIFAMPPAVRLTNLGIRQVPRETVEAGLAFGCTPSQLLFKVQIPNAMPSIMAGVNQNIMLALSMVVIASMIGAGGLGDPVLRGIQRLNIGMGFEGGLGVVLLAIILDRITQSFGRPRTKRLVTRIRELFGTG
ncbi:MAG: proline/glycine betaine ABC transporter permease [Desulfobacterales bacterium]